MFKDADDAERKEKEAERERQAIQTGKRRFRGLDGWLGKDETASNLIEKDKEPAKEVKGKDGDKKGRTDKKVGVRKFEGLDAWLGSVGGSPGAAKKRKTG